MADRVVSVKLVADVNGYTADLAKAAAATRALGDAGKSVGKDVGLGLDDAGRSADDVTDKVKKTKREVDGLGKTTTKPKIELSDGDASAKISAIRDGLAELAAARAEAKVTGDTSDLRVKLAEAKAQLDEIAGSNSSARVSAEVDGATANIRAVESELNRIDGRTVNATVNVRTNNTGDSSGGLKSLAMGLSPALLPLGAVGLAGGLAAGAGGAAALPALGAAALGYSNVADAVKLLGNQQLQQTLDSQKSGAQAVQTAAAQASAARQVSSAEAALENARANAADAASRAASQVSKARQSEAQAEVDSRQGIVDAQAQATKDVTSAINRERDAQKTLAAAQKDTRQAVVDLSAAEKTAQQQFEDTANSLADNTLAQRQVTLDLADARKDLQDAQASGDAEKIERATLALDQQLQRQKELTLQGKRLQDQQDENTRTGVEGSATVVAARQKVVDAQAKEAEASRDASNAAELVDEARVDGAAKVTKAQQDGAAKIATAQAAVADAVAAQAQQQRQSAYSIQQAQAQVAAAHAAAGAAAQKDGDDTSDAMKRINEQLALLSPATVAFAGYVQNKLAPAFQGLQQANAGELLPRTQQALDILMTKLPQVTGFTTAFSRELGDLEIDAARALTGPWWSQFFNDIEKHGIPILDDFGHAAGDIAQGAGGIIQAFLPMGEQVADGIKRAADQFAEWGANLKDSDEFQKFTDYVQENWPKIEAIIGNVAGIIEKLVQAGAPIGSAIMSGFQALSGVLSALPVPVVEALLVAFLGYKAVSGVVGTINGVADSFAALKGNIAGLPDKLSGLAGSFGLMQDGTAGAADSASAASDELGGLGDGVTETMGAFDKLAKAAPIVGSAIGLLAAATAAGKQEIDDWAKALHQGGDAADQAAAELQHVTDVTQPGISGLHSWGDAWDRAKALTLGTVDAQEEARKKAGELWAAMSPLQQAQEKVAEWQDTLNRRMHDGSSSSEDVRAAQERLTYWTGQVAGQQGELDTATGKTNDQLDKYSSKLSAAGSMAEYASQSSDTLKSSLDSLTGAHVSQIQAESQFYDALQNAKGALQGVNGAVLDGKGDLDLHTDAGRKTADALVSLKDKANDVISAMVAQGGTLQDVQKKDGELRQSFYDTAYQMTGSKKAAEDLTNQIYGIPEQRTTAINMDTHNASTYLSDLQKQIDDMRGKNIEITVSAQGGLATYTTDQRNLLYGGKATGGPIHGPGTGTSDTAGLYALSNGEHVWTAAEVSAAGGHGAMEAMRQQVLAAGRGRADGGAVGVNVDIDQRQVDAAITAMQQQFSVGPSGGAGGAEQWRPVVMQALAMLGQSPALANGVLHMIQAESGGNPNAINLWDSNAKAGHPSRGLMQTIPGTFERWRSPVLPDNIVDPLANIYSGINYALHTYGAAMVAAGGRKSATGGYLGYAAGGTTPAHEPFWVGEQGPELMWSDREQYVSTATQSREMSGAAAGGGSTSVSVAAPNVTVVLDGREIASIARVEAGQVVVQAFTGVNRGLSASGVR